MSEENVRFELREEVAILRIDDGKANALSEDLIASLQRGLDRAEKEARATLIVGRPGRFSGGFDLAVMRKGGPPVAELVNSGAELALRMFSFPTPVVIACTGHAIAMGAILCMAADKRIGMAGDFKIGLNEVGIGMTLPVFGVEFALARLSPRHQTRAVVEAELYSPEGAVEAGFLDWVTSPEQLVDEAFAEAARLSALDPNAHRNTKLRLRKEFIARIQASLEDDKRQLSGAGS